MTHFPELLTQGFILNRQAFDRQGSLVLRYWLKHHEKISCVDIEDEKAVFFIEQANNKSAQEVINQHFPKHVELKALSLQSFQFKPMSAIYCCSLNTYYQVRDKLKEVGIKCFEDDIRPEDRFLMERFITDSMLVSASSCQLYPHYQYYVGNRAKSIVYKPALNALSLDIECDMDGTLFSIGGYSDSEQKVLMVGEPEVEAPVYIEWMTNEKELLVAMINWLNHLDPDVIIGWNVVGFDFALLQKRCDLHGIKFAIGRDETEPGWRQNRNQQEQQFIHIAGRVVLDGIDVLKTATYNFASFALENVAQEMLGTGKKVSSVDNRVAEIQYNFKYNKQALAEYNLIDCQLVWDIFAKANLFDFSILRAHLTGLAIDRTGGSVAAFTNLYLPKLHRAGFIAPNLGDGEQDFHSPGGYVMDSIPGLYHNVLVLDFKSLYPSIIRTFKIDPLGMIEGMANTDNSIAGFDGAKFSRQTHFLPEIIEQLWRERDRAKLEKNAALSQAIKIIMNSFYGVLGSNGCRFYDPRLSGSITKRSHQILKETKSLLEQRGLKVIYGDTDSIFVLVDQKASAENCQKIGYELMCSINEYWQQRLTEEFQLESFLEIEFETHFSRFFMPTIRGLEVGTKKRYAGLTSNNGKEKLIFKGLEAVRTDWTELAREFQRKLYQQIFHDQPVQDFVLDTVANTRNGQNDHKLIYRKRLRRKLSSYVKNVPPHVKAAIKADEHNRQSGKPLKYQNRGWVEYVMTVNGPEVVEQRVSAIDYDLYVERQIQAVADAILPFVNTSFSEIVDDQLSLF